MALDVKVPVLPESVVEATIARWHKKAGDSVEQDELLVDIETDKVVLEVTAVSAGVLTEITEKEGAQVRSEQLIGSLKVGVTQSATESKPSKEAKDSSPKTSPAVRKMLQENSIELIDIQNNLNKDRLIPEDVIDINLLTLSFIRIRTPIGPYSAKASP